MQIIKIANLSIILYVKLKFKKTPNFNNLNIKDKAKFINETLKEYKIN